MKESNTKKDSKGVIFDMKKSKIILIFMLGFMYGERGDLISAEMLSTRTLGNNQIYIDSWENLSSAFEYSSYNELESKVLSYII